MFAAAPHCKRKGEWQWDTLVRAYLTYAGEDQKLRLCDIPCVYSIAILLLNWEKTVSMG